MMKEGIEMPSSILSYLGNAFLEWLLILLLLLNSMFSALVFRFANHFRLKKPCLCCSSSAFDMSYTDLICRHHATLIASSILQPPNKLLLQPPLDTRFRRNLITTNFSQNLRYAAPDDDHSSFIDEKTILEGTGTGPDHHQHHHRDASSLRDFVSIRHLYSNEKLVEFDFTEDEYDQKHIVQDDGLTWRYAFSEAQPLIIDNGSTRWLGHDRESPAAGAVSMRENMLQTQDMLMIKQKKVNEDESYSIAYTAEGDLVMDLCRNLAFAKSISTASDNVDAILHNKATTEKQADELSHQAHGKTPALQNIDQVAHSVCPSPSFRTEELVCEQVQGTSVPAFVDLSSENGNGRNGEDAPHALPSSPMPTNMEEISEMQLERYQEQTPALPFPLPAFDHLDFCQIDNQGSDLVDKSEYCSVQHPLTISVDLIKNEEEKHLDTPSSFNGAHNHYSNWLLYEKRESVTEETFDGSINSDFECGEGISTVDKLKTALRVERKALHALYAELEEERNASAVAACQTMAMINRLQEEKASVQMEALHYQRMMEEQSEYDQEALQLLNELMVKRETEKQELEKELEIYRRRVIYYETKERLMMLNRKEESLTSGSSSVSCNNAEDCDRVPMDLKGDMKYMNGFEGIEENGINSTPFDDVLHMEESFMEEERLSILEQFRALEGKVFTLDSENDGLSFNHDYSCIMNGTENGCHDDAKGNYYRERRIIGPKAKRLLPLFDATIDGNESKQMSRNENGHDFTSYPHSSASIYEIENIENIEEEMDHVYERLLTLEADKEFLMHCFSSLNRGDKGLELLQEILQHLRNLRTV